MIRKRVRFYALPTEWEWFRLAKNPEAQGQTRGEQVKKVFRYNANELSSQNDHGNLLVIRWVSRGARGSHGCFFRAITYAVLFIGLVLIYVPARLLSWSGIVYPATIEIPQVIGMVIASAGAAVAL